MSLMHDPKPSDMSHTNSSKYKKSLLACGALLLGVACVIVLRSQSDKDTENHRSASNKPESRATGTTSQSGSPLKDQPAQTAIGKDHSAPDTPRTSTRPRRPTDSKRAGRISVVDPMASWRETPPWPDGPKLVAEVESSSKRYINLRPNDMGIMPMLNVDLQETLSVRLSLPENQPGDAIYLELPNGGNFPGEELRGKTMVVSDARTLEFQMNAAAVRGNCTIYIRQAGHTRTLPLWIGEPNATLSEDTTDPNLPAS
jgi:hypothetical protein